MADRVLHIISGIAPESGGPSTALQGLVDAQRQAGLQCSVAFSWVNHPATAVVESLRAKGISVDSLGPCRDPMSRHPSLATWVDGLVRQADIVHIHALWESIQHHAVRAALRHGIPYIITPHGMIDRWNMSNGTIKKRLYLALRMKKNLRLANAIHFATQQELDWTVPLPLPQRQIVEPFGIDFTEFDNLPTAGAFRREFPAVSGRPYVLFLGRVDRGKGWEYLIPAFAKATANPSLQDWGLVVAGPDYFGNLAKARQLAGASGVAERTLFTGMLSGRQRLAALKDCELLALPSCHENFGIVVAEAMAAGVPVLVSDQVGLHDEVTRWEAGAVTSLDVAEISAALEKWLTDPSRRRRAGENGRVMARQHFDWNAIAGRWVAHYHAIISESSGRHS